MGWLVPGVGRRPPLGSISRGVRQPQAADRACETVKAGKAPSVVQAHYQ
jgi:hypothetical protein